jgi:hypothetical protein
MIFPANQQTVNICFFSMGIQTTGMKKNEGVSPILHWLSSGKQT